ncbi:hypothetical protein [Streptomyces sp. NPDC087270]|uniref:hypothetical protein n=1 Tax=Streptomyces sp. NPDC087270 TaxID=3365774 RepID=UPI003819F1E6
MHQDRRRRAVANEQPGDGTWTRTGTGAGMVASGRDPRALPKAELHLHLLAAMRPATLAELASDAGRAAPDPRGFADFEGFQQV